MPTAWPQSTASLFDQLARPGARPRWIVYDLDSGTTWDCWTKEVAEVLCDWLERKGCRVDCEFFGW